MSDGSEDKKHSASHTKLRKQRDQGSVASGQESSSFLAAALGLILIAAMAGTIWQQFQRMIIKSFDLVGMPFDQAVEVGLRSVGPTLLILLLPLVGIALSIAFLAAVIYNKGLLFALKPVSPQIARINPIEGFKRIYGKRGWVETGISVLRISSWLIFAGLLGALPMLKLLQQSTCMGACLVNQMLPVFKILLIGAPLILILAAVSDMIVQRKLFLGEQKMTETEKKRETKDQHGTPEIRQERQRRMREAARPMRKPGAENATMCFYHRECAVGIEFKPPSVILPYVVAKARTAEEAVKLRKAISRKGWPEMEHPILTRAALARPEGDALDEANFATFIEAVNAMFER